MAFIVSSSVLSLHRLTCGPSSLFSAATYNIGSSFAWQARTGTHPHYHLSSAGTARGLSKRKKVEAGNAKYLAMLKSAEYITQLKSLCVSSGPSLPSANSADASPNIQSSP